MGDSWRIPFFVGLHFNHDSPATHFLRKKMQLDQKIEGWFHSWIYWRHRSKTWGCFSFGLLCLNTIKHSTPHWCWVRKKTKNSRGKIGVRTQPAQKPKQTALICSAWQQILLVNMDNMALSIIPVLLSLHGNTIMHMNTKQPKETKQSD